MPTPRYLSGTDGFIPEPTGQAIAYVRDPAKFKFNQYAQVVNCPAPVVTYAFLDPDQPVRVVTDQEFDWPDNMPRPKPQSNLGNFLWNEVRVFRRYYGYTVGEQAANTAKGWNPTAFFNAIVASQAATNISNRFVALMEATGGWGANTATATVLNGGAGKWNVASSDETSVNFLAIKKSLLEAIRRASLATNNMMGFSDWRLIISPGLAIAMANTSEVHSYLAQNPVALEQLRGNAPNQNMMWGLPATLYGVTLIVEDAPRVNIRQSADGTVATLGTQKVFCKSDTSAVLCSQVGGLDGQYGSPSFSTFQRYIYKYELSVEARYDEWNKLYEAGVVDQFKEVLAAPQAGFLITTVT